MRVNIQPFSLISIFHDLNGITKDKNLPWVDVFPAIFPIASQRTWRSPRFDEKVCLLAKELKQEERKAGCLFEGPLMSSCVLFTV